MRAWEHRPDTAVVDEPFYAHYLVHVDAGHPGRDRIIASQATDWTEVVDMLLGPVPGGRRIFYQKHMCHHFLPGMEGDWLAQLDNVFLLRDPTAMLASLAKVLDRLRSSFASSSQGNTLLRYGEKRYSCPSKLGAWSRTA